MGIFVRLIYQKTHRTITLFTIMLTVYSIHYLCNPTHTKTNTNSQAHVPHPIDTQLIITQETPSTPSGQLTPSTSQEPEETLSNHPSYVVKMDSPLIQWN
jgi:hypothetical protein